jgi:hypothetical protein
MTRKRKPEFDPQEASLLDAGLKVAQEVVGSSLRAISRGVGQAARLNRAVLDYEADLIEPVSPTAAKLLRPKRANRTERSLSGRTRVARAGATAKQATQQASKQVAKRVKAAGKAVVGAEKRTSPTAKGAAKRSK